jgi:DNA polymerase-1
MSKKQMLFFNELEFRRMAEQFDSIFKKEGTATQQNLMMMRLIQKSQQKSEDQFDLFGSGVSDESSEEPP